MDPSQETDPFCWNEARVIEELCTSNRSWDVPAAKRLPDPGTFAAKLRENEVDGESLLTYEDSFGDKLFLQEFLQNRLGLKNIRHQIAVKNLVRVFKSKSPGYRAWKVEHDDHSLTDPIEEDKPLVQPFTSTKVNGAQDMDDRDPKAPQDVLPPEPATSTVTHRPDSRTATDRGLFGASPSAHKPRQTDISDMEQQLLPVNEINGTGAKLAAPSPDQSFLTAQARPGLSPADPEAEEPPKKKRRIAPTTVTTSVNNTPHGNFLPSEADGIIAKTKRHLASKPGKDGILIAGTPEYFLGTQHSRLSYLGEAFLRSEDITKPDIRPLDDDREFALPSHKFIPSGRRIQVHRAMRTFLQPGPFAASKVRSQGNSDDEILPLFGDSDEELDEETIRQIEKDEAEDRKIEARRIATQVQSLLSTEVVKATIQASVQSIEVDWVLKKQPKLDRRANKMWQDARRQNSRHIQISLAEARQKHLDQRITKLTDQILAERWFNKTDIERQCSILEQTIHDRQHHRWLIKMLSSRHQPPKPATLPRPIQQAKKTYTNLEEDEEIISSGSDEDDFIDDSEHIQFSDGDPMGVDDNSDSDSGHELEGATSESQMSNDSPVVKLDSPTNPGSSRETELLSRGNSSVPIIIRTPRKVDKAREIVDITSSPTSPDASIIEEPPAYDAIREIRDLGLEHWEHVRDPERLVIAVLETWGIERDSLFNHVKHREPQYLWEKCILRIEPNIKPDPQNALSTPAAKRKSLAFRLARLFDAYVSCSAQRLHQREFRQPTIQRMHDSQAKFLQLCAFLRKIAPNFPPVNGMDRGRATTSSFRHAPDLPSYEELYDSAEDSEGSKVRREKKSLLPENRDEEDDLPDMTSPGKKRRRRVKLDQAAENLRITTFERNAELEGRRRQLRERLAVSSIVPGDKSRLIINEAKKDEHGFIYVHDHIGQRIKSHQVDGVRFMWNQLVVDSDPQQGCLLAHTMGLGKTMQVITLLVAIAQASSSKDPAIFSQIPENLREPKTLILCPAGLVDNWLDELLLWAPEESLGQLRSVTSGDGDEAIREWARGGGVLVIGYAMFRNLVKDEEIAALLREEPNIVVGDEAHILKNPTSQISRATQDFRTMSRIAMTGSPLTNNVLDYYAMINWVAPNYLANIDEFRSVYATPIKEGLYSDSSPYEKRKALKLLKVLKETVAPKVHRMGISTLKHQLPNKKEFILSLPLTDIQTKAYSAYIYGVLHDPLISGLLTGNSRIWSLVNHLTGLVAHPAIFKKWLEDRKQKLREAPKDPEEPAIVLPEHFISDLSAIVALRDIANVKFSWKVVVLLRILEESKRIGDKVLIFSQSIPTLDFLQGLFIQKRLNYSRLDGSTGIKVRQHQVKNFNSDRGADVYLISTRAGGVGLNIFGANRVVIFDFKYTPAEEQQAVGRAYRIGQTKQVFVYWLIAGGTYEGTIQSKSVFKMQLASRVVDKKNPIAWSKRLGDYFGMPKTPDRHSTDGYLGQDSVLDTLLKDNNLRGAICQITSTDTFEEEEEAELTHEEVLEATTMIELNRLRHQDPAEYQRQERDRLTALQNLILNRPMSDLGPTAVPDHMRHSALGPQALQSGNSSLAQSSQTTVAFPMPLTGNHGFGPPSRPAHPVASTPGQAKTFGNFLAHAAVSSKTPQSTQPPPSGSFQPVMGAGTSYRSSSQPVFTHPATAKSTLNESVQSTKGSEHDKEESLTESFGSAREAIKRLGLPVTKAPQEWVKQVSNCLNEQGKHTLERMEFLVNLKKILQKYPRLAAAVLRGCYEATALASKTKQGLLELAAKCDEMELSVFNEMLKTRHDPDTREANIHRTPPSTQETLADDDGVAMKQILEGSTSRVRDRLPWLSGKHKRGAKVEREPSTPQRGPSQPRPGDSLESPHLID